MHYVRDGGVAYVPWIDRQVVTLLSPHHKANAFTMIQQSTQGNGQHVVLDLR